MTIASTPNITPSSSEDAEIFLNTFIECSNPEVNKSAVESKGTKKKRLISRSNFEKNTLQIYAIAFGENAAFFAKILVISHPQKPFHNTFPLYFYAIIYTVYSTIESIINRPFAYS